jgi:hypothetical protein
MAALRRSLWLRVPLGSRLARDQKSRGLHRCTPSLAGLGLALEDFRSREGKYPASLQDLGLPEARIIDPFTARPFIYRTENDHVMVYSVGFDRQDHDGTSRGVSGRRDLVWEIKRQPRTP